MLIAFVHNNKAFLPEVAAYVDYFRARGIACEVVRPEGLQLLEPDVAWHFMGTNLKKKRGVLTIHEYTSASVEPYASIKNSIKKWSNAKPDYRIFLNEYVRSAFTFKDEVPFGFRDMGIRADWLKNAGSVVKNRKGFIYVGELEGRGIDKLLDLFAEGSMKGNYLLIVSKDYEHLLRDYKNYSNIEFEGPVANGDIREYVGYASFGINFMPDKEPYNRQTSTKLLEYAACRANIITTDYEWVRKFQEKYGGNFFYIKDDLSNFTSGAVEEFDYSFPDLTEWTWEKQIERSGVMAFLEKRFPELSSRSS